MNKTKVYWKHLLKKNTKFDVGAERIIYSILQRASDLGEPNSSPVGSDLMFENSEFANKKISLNFISLSIFPS